jgi:hypothetical protein
MVSPGPTSRTSSSDLHESRSAQNMIKLFRRSMKMLGDSSADGNRCLG